MTKSEKLAKQALEKACNWETRVAYLEFLVSQLQQQIAEQPKFEVAQKMVGFACVERDVDGSLTQWNMSVEDPGGLATFTFDEPLEEGEKYCAFSIPQESATDRDAIDPNVVEGSMTPTGFQMMNTTGDNGAAADPIVDAPYCVVAFRIEDVLVPAS